MNTAYDISEVLLKQAYMVSTELEGAQFLSDSWQAVAKHCATAKRPSQSESAQVHVTSSQSLSQDLHILSEKFRQLSSKYRQEAAIIDKARRTKTPVNDVQN